MSRRLRAISPAKWVERMLPPTATPLPHSLLQAGAATFFPGVRGAGTTARFREQIVGRAEAIREGRFDLLGYHRLSFGKPIDWHLDPVSGRRAPRRHWSRIDPLDSASVGDCKVTWELNRHAWLVALGQAYRLSGDARHADTATRYLREWMAENPPGLGINWASSLEAALRMIAWSWALFLFAPAAEFSPQFRAVVLKWISIHAAHVARYLSYYFSPNTHLTGEALGLFYVGVLFPELPEARHWSALGSRILDEQSARQILDDGVYFEQSTAYQRYTLEIYLHYLILAALNGVAVPREVGERVERLVDFLLAARHPDGSMPEIGDADGGTLLALAPRAPDDFRAVFSTAAVLFGR
ncbi:MAG TPA: heparinase II/III family protein, partial [Candidatus Polarisedimenticolaceae bacterium]|nr:heparinase II/III family protein [Candidatus Polarisedimenticolaceae bacterium]